MKKSLYGLMIVTSLAVAIDARADASPIQSCQLDVIAGYDGNGVRIHSTFQIVSDEFKQASGILSYVGSDANDVPLTDGIGHLANGHTGVLSYRGEKTVLLVIDWPEGIVTSGSINGLPIEPSLTNVVACQPS